MKCQILFSLVVLFSGVWCDDSDVIELDTHTFDEGVQADLMLIEFYAPWCGHCKKLAPEYEKAATTLKKNDPPVPLAKVDCPANTAVCSKYGVTGYPTLKIFRDGELSADYNGPRSAPGIVDYMRKQSGPSSRELTSLEAVRNFVDHDEHSVVGFFASNSPLKEAFMTASNALRENFRFGHTTATDATKEYGYTDNVVIFQPPFMATKLEKTPFEYTEGPQAEKLKTFIKQNFMGIAGVRETDTQKYFEDKKPLCVVYYDVEYSLDPKGTNYWRNRVIKVAREFEGRVSFAISDKDDFVGELEALGISGGKGQPSAGIYDMNGKYVMDATSKFSVDTLKAFVQSYLDGDLETYMKSEPVPESNDGPVKVVVGRNFDEIVNDETKDVLIEFYAPWCGHCKTLAPKYDQLGEMLKDDPNIVIAKTDATANDFPPTFDVRGFPTLYWVPADDKSRPRKYEGGREVEDFVQFIKDSATNQPPVLPGAGDKKKGKKQEL